MKEVTGEKPQMWGELARLGAEAGGLPRMSEMPPPSQ
jgi:hypothetical protein